MKHQPTATPPPHAAPDNKPPRSAKQDKDTPVPAPLTSGHGHNEVIRQTAYFIYVARNGENGHELDDWLKAEAQLAGMPTQDAGEREPAAQAA